MQQVYYCSATGVVAEQYSRKKHRGLGIIPPGSKKRFVASEEGAQYETSPTVHVGVGQEVALNDKDWVVKINNRWVVFPDPVFQAIFSRRT